MALRMNFLFTPLKQVQAYQRSLSLSAAICSNKTGESKPKAEMRFVTYQKKGCPDQHIGALSADGTCVTHLSSSVGMVDFIKDFCTEKVCDQLKSGKTESICDVKLLAPIKNPEKIVCIGLNYSGHCKEQNKPVPTQPMFFSKFASAIIGPTDEIVAHKITKKMDWEVEMAVIIGSTAKNVEKKDAMSYVFGYSVAQDISARDWQKDRNGGQFLIGKSMDTFCPLGPSIVHKSLIEDPHNLKISCKVNGILKQCGNTKELVFRIDDIIHRLTQCITLKPGDVILTGTPGGVGMYRQPPEYLCHCDFIESEIEKIGKMNNKVVS